MSILESYCIKKVSDDLKNCGANKDDDFFELIGNLIEKMNFKNLYDCAISCIRSEIDGVVKLEEGDFQIAKEVRNSVAHGRTYVPPNIKRDKDGIRKKLKPFAFDERSEKRCIEYVL